MIVLAGNTAIEAAAKQAGHDVEVPFTPGRKDATQEFTDVQAMDVLEPVADGFRNFAAEGSNRRRLLAMDIEWQKSADGKDLYEAKNRETGKVVWTGTSVALLFGPSSELRALAEVYAGDDAQQEFVDDFVVVWVKVMDLDRLDVKRRSPAGPGPAIQHIEHLRHAPPPRSGGVVVLGAAAEPRTS